MKKKKLPKGFWTKERLFKSATGTLNLEQELFDINLQRWKNEGLISDGDFEDIDKQQIFNDSIKKLKEKKKK